MESFLAGIEEWAVHNVVVSTEGQATIGNPFEHKVLVEIDGDYKYLYTD